MKKSVFTLFLLFVVVFLSFGFSTQTQAISQPTNAFRICRYQTTKGESSLSYIFPVNSKELSQVLTEEEMTGYKFYLSMFINALSKSNAQKQVAGVKLENCVYFQDVDGLGFSIIFENSQAQDDFFGSGENSSKSKQQTSGFFMKKVTLETNFPISVATADSLRGICQMALESWSKENDVDQEKKDIVNQIILNAGFIYDFATQEKNLLSEVMYEEGEFNHNYFQKSYSQLSSDSKILFWTISPNRPIWYIFALIFVVSGMIVAYFWRKTPKKR